MTREEAIEKIRKMSLPQEMTEILEALAPELLESEDERLRKEAISIVQSYMNICDEEGDPCLSGYRVLAYLERQKKLFESGRGLYYYDEMVRKELIEQVGYIIPDKEEYDDEGRVLPIYHKRIERYRAWLEKQKEQTEELSTRLNGVMQEYIKAGKNEEEQEHRLKCYKLFWDALEDSEFFEQFKQKDQKPAEWSEEEAKKAAENYADEFPGMTHESDGSTIEDYDKPYNDFMAGVLWVKHQYQPKQEWCEEDKKMRLEAIKRIDELEFLGIPCNNVRNVLESLCPSWKPSEEQMKTLKNVVETYRIRHNASTGGDNTFIKIESLYQELLKLG